MQTVNTNGPSIVNAKPVTSESPANESAATATETHTSPSDPARQLIMVGLDPGRVVQYVMANGQTRPLHITRVIDAAAGIVNGILLFDGAEDRAYFPQRRPLACGESGHLPDCTAHLRAVEFFDPETAEGLVTPADTWHWPKRTPVFAAAVDSNAISTVVMAMLSNFEEVLVKRFGDIVNEKSEALLASVNASIDSHADLVERLADKRGPTRDELEQWLEDHNIVTKPGTELPEVIGKLGSGASQGLATSSTGGAYQPMDAPSVHELAQEAAASSNISTGAAQVSDAQGSGDAPEGEQTAKPEGSQTA